MSKSRINDAKRAITAVATIPNPVELLYGEVKRTASDIGGLETLYNDAKAIYDATIGLLTSARNELRESTSVPKFPTENRNLRIPLNSTKGIEVKFNYQVPNTSFFSKLSSNRDRFTRIKGKIDYGSKEVDLPEIIFEDSANYSTLEREKIIRYLHSVVVQAFIETHSQQDNPKIDEHFPWFEGDLVVGFSKLFGDADILEAYLGVKTQPLVLRNMEDSLSSFRSGLEVLANSLSEKQRSIEGTLETHSQNVGNLLLKANGAIEEQGRKAVEQINRIVESVESEVENYKNDRRQEAEKEALAEVGRKKRGLELELEKINSELEEKRKILTVRKGDLSKGFGEFYSAVNSIFPNYDSYRDADDVDDSFKTSIARELYDFTCSPETDFNVSEILKVVSTLAGKTSRTENRRKLVANEVRKIIDLTKVFARTQDTASLQSSLEILESFGGKNKKSSLKSLESFLTTGLGD